MKLFSPPIDLTAVSTVVYHLPDGPALSLKIDGIEEYLDLELELGHICDTSAIDGVIHFFPKDKVLTIIMCMNERMYVKSYLLFSFFLLFIYLFI